MVKGLRGYCPACTLYGGHGRPVPAACSDGVSTDISPDSTDLQGLKLPNYVPSLAVVKKQEV
ncbi:hypothetical protein N7453_003122 [Penicillium expansum]|nr:hypothetical protein N7453_003122 [Penicillium expansum]